jgi:dolichol-phosphate mannosyltransferase
MGSIASTPAGSRVQFLKFCVVGASGYAINIGAFAVALALSLEHLVAATVAFLVAVASNFWCNRHWTFAADDRALARQAARFFTVSALGFLFAATVLELLVGFAGFPALAAQPASVLAATPLTFLGSKSWSFADGAPAYGAVRAPAEGAPGPNTWLVVPTYNEAENLEPFVRKVLPQLASAASEHHLLIVDDSSPDGTGEIADRLAAELDSVEVLHRTEKDGLGRAYAAGFERALAEGAELVMQMDADFSHDPEHVPALIAASREADVVLDLTGGFKCFRREVIERLAFSGFQTAGFGFQVEVTYRALRAGARVREVPILFRDRQVGASKMSSRIVFEAIWRVLELRLRRDRSAARPALRAVIQPSS